MSHFDESSQALQGDQTTRRNFLGGMLGTTASVGVVAVAGAGSLGGSSLVEALDRLNRAQEVQAELDRQPLASAEVQDRAMDAATRAESQARRDLVLLIAAAAQVPLEACAENEESWAIYTQHVPLASYLEGDRLFLLVPTRIGDDSGTAIRSASGRVVSIRPVVVGFASSRSRPKRREITRTVATRSFLIAS